MRRRLSSRLFPRLFSIVVLTAGFGCAGVKPHEGTGSGGTGGTMVMTMPALPGLTGLTVSPSSTTLSLSAGTIAGTLTGSASFTANGTFMDGTSKDVTAQVNWSSQPTAGIQTISSGNVTVTAPGTYTITAYSGNVSATATLTAQFSGGFTCTDFDTAANCASFDKGTETVLDGNASGTTSIAYPLDGALFPANLGPIQVQTATGGTSARVSFKTASGNVNASFYGACETGPGPGCYVTIPLSFTQLMIPSSATEDIQLTARVSSGGAPVESAPIKVDWAQTGLAGGLYYWTVIPSATEKSTPTPGSYVLLDTSQQPPNGTAIYRYNFAKDNPTPEQIWTDDGGPGSMPSYQGAPQSYVAATGQYGGHCIGCHAITNDGKYMALTIGGSSTYNGSNWELLDIGAQALEIINPSASTDPTSSPTQDPTDYWKKFRKDAFATETAWGPNDDVMVSMYNAKLYLNTVAVNGAATTIAQSGLALPNSAAKIDPYQSDPFWSHDGSLFVYTSFSQAATPDSIGNPMGLNGDLKTGGQIAIATGSKTGLNDDAKVLVSRGSNVSSYYPCVSEDSAYVVFNQSACTSGVDFNGAGTYGSGTCDGYDDSSAKLWLVPSSGGATTRLDKANGGNGNSYDNSWPRFSPDVGTFRGNKLYWVAFSSRRPYGVQANTGTLAASQPQLWFAGVSFSEITVGDPSFAPVWLPGQNPMGNTTLYGNHVPQWVKVAIIIDAGGV